MKNNFLDNFMINIIYNSNNKYDLSEIYSYALANRKIKLLLALIDINYSKICDETVIKSISNNKITARYLNINKNYKVSKKELKNSSIRVAIINNANSYEEIKNFVSDQRISVQSSLINKNFLPENELINIYTNLYEKKVDNFTKNMLSEIIENNINLYPKLAEKSGKKLSIFLLGKNVNTSLIGYQNLVLNLITKPLRYHLLNIPDDPYKYRASHWGEAENLKNLNQVLINLDKLLGYNQDLQYLQNNISPLIDNLINFISQYNLKHIQVTYGASLLAKTSTNIIDYQNYIDSLDVNNLIDISNPQTAKNLYIAYIESIINNIEHLNKIKFFEIDILNDIIKFYLNKDFLSIYKYNKIIEIILFYKDKIFISNNYKYTLNLLINLSSKFSAPLFENILFLIQKIADNHLDEFLDLLLSSEIYIDDKIILDLIKIDLYKNIILNKISFSRLAKLTKDNNELSIFIENYIVNKKLQKDDYELLEMLAKDTQLDIEKLFKLINIIKK